MKSKIIRIVFTVLTFCILLVVAGLIFHKKIAARYIPQIEQIGTIHVTLKNDTSYINFRLAVTNKTFLRIEIDTVTYKISLFNKTYLQKQYFLGVVLPGNGKDTIQISIKIPYVAILKDLAGERRKGDSTSYSVQLYLKCATIFGKSEISVNRAAKLKIPPVPELEIIEIKWNRIRLKSILAHVTIKLTNHSAITLAIKDLIYAMEFLDQGNIKGVYRDPIIIKPNGETLVTFPIEISPHNIVKTAFEVITNKDKYKYTLTLGANLESNDSLKEKFHVEFIKNGKMELKK